MEYLDYYDEYGNYAGSEDRNIIHEKGLWHKTVHCWLFDKSGNIYFQIRADSHKLYTSASGHVSAGETVKDGFAREVMEEIGVKVDVSNAQMVEINIWKLDKLKNGKMFKDRAFANVYINLIDENNANFVFDTNEVEGIVKVNAKDTLELLIKQSGQIKATKYLATKKGIDKRDDYITFNDFLIFENEIGIIKYGKILQAIINETK